MRNLIVILTTVLVLAIAGCSQDEPETASEPTAEGTTTTETQPAAETAEPAAEPAEPAAEPAQEATTEQDTETITSEACLEAVRNETSESDVTVSSNEFSEANTIVMLEVGADKAQWKCLVANDGTVQEVSLAGTD